MPDSEDDLLLASLYTVMHVLETDGEDAVAWYVDGMDSRQVLKNLLVDSNRREERLAFFREALNQRQTCGDASSTVCSYQC